MSHTRPAGPTLAHEIDRMLAAEEHPLDARVTYHGSICILHPLTPAAEAWIEENIDPDAQRWGSDNGVVIEPRYMNDILNNMRGAGLRVF